jgi:small subunit ribosomal protein S15
MARMHSKKHGKSKSRKPVSDTATAPEISDKEIMNIIEGHAKKGMSQTLIGQKLKDEHEVKYIKHTMGKRLGAILEEIGYKQQIPQDLMDLMKKAVNINNHLSANSHDIDNRIRMKKIESKIWRLTKYYIGTGKLPSTWRYDPKQAELLIKST